MKSARFYRVIGVVATLVVIAAFAPGLHASTRKAPVTPLVWLHGALFTSWLLLYLAQTTLVAAGRPHLHRRLGVVGVLLAIAMAWVGYSTAVAMGRRGFDLSGDLDAASDPLGTLVFPLGDLLSFAILVTAAVWWRRRAEYHKRLMMLATVGSLMAAPLAHLIGRIPALRETPPFILLPLAAFYLAGAVRDRIVGGRFHPVSLWGGLSLLAWAQLRAGVIGPSEAWHRLAGWLIS